MSSISARAALLFAVVTAAPVAAQNADEALARAESAYRSLTSLRAEFTQTIANPMLGDPEVSRGVLFLAKPDKFAMRFAEPAGDRLVADGEWLWIYTPSTVPGQVIKQTIPQSGHSTPNLFSQFVEGARTRYRARYQGTAEIGGEQVDLVHLTPLSEEPFLEATIGVARDTGLLRLVAFTEVSGQTRRFVFDTIQPNVEIASAELQFEIPAGARVVTP